MLGGGSALQRGYPVIVYMQRSSSIVTIMYICRVVVVVVVAVIVIIVLCLYVYKVFINPTSNRKVKPIPPSILSMG